MSLVFVNIPSIKTIMKCQLPLYSEGEPITRGRDRIELHARTVAAAVDAVWLCCRPISRPYLPPRDPDVTQVLFQKSTSESKEQQTMRFEAR